ncbi:MAG TPA: L,D-transpeptidase [Longimicrobiaceae bacterium]|nr:L,D-transpeptidase [Longimicrobiaceae bacterium]
MDARTTRTGGPERRSYTPPGRLRRIFFDHRGVTLAMLGGAALLAVLFVSATAWAVNERYERDVAKIAYAHDARSLAFLERQEQRSIAEMEGKAKELEEREAELVPADRPYLVVSIAERKVSYVRGSDTIFAAPVAVGSGKTLVMGGKTKRFQTPRGRMTISHKELDPVWVPPNWHYVEIARKRGLRLVDMSNAHPNALAGFPAGREPIRGGTIYIPPWGSPQRKHKGVLGAAKLEMQDGYYFHGTDNEASIGTAASHGCIRMRRADVLWMYENVPVGTQVYIY